MTHKRVSIQIDPSVYAAARLAARRANVNVGEVVEQALRQHEGVLLVLGAMAFIEGTARARQLDDLRSLNDHPIELSQEELGNVFALHNALLRSPKYVVPHTEVGDVFTVRSDEMYVVVEIDRVSGELWLRPEGDGGDGREHLATTGPSLAAQIVSGEWECVSSGTINRLAAIFARLTSPPFLAWDFLAGLSPEYTRLLEDQYEREMAQALEEQRVRRLKRQS